MLWAKPLAMGKAAKMDAADKKILRIIPNDACVSISAIASEAGLSQSPCWKRLKEFAAQEVIKRRLALFDPAKIGLQMTVFVSIQAGEHSDGALARFAAEVASMER